MLKTSLHESITELDPARWDAVPGDPFSTHAVLEALEGAGLPGVRLSYAVLEDTTGRWRAVAPLAHVQLDAMQFMKGSLRRGIRTVRRIYPGFMQTSTMIVGTPLSVGNPPARLDPAADPGPLWAALSGVLQEAADEAGAPWRVFKELPDCHAGGVPGELARQGWTLLPSEPGFVLPLRWSTYSEYLADLRSAYRYRIRRAAQTLDCQGIQIDVAPLAEVYDEEFHALYECVVARAPVVFERLTLAFFRELGRAHSAAAPLLRFRRNGRVVGWVVMFFADGTAYDLFHGIDYEENRRSAIYHNQLAAVIQLAIERGARRLSLGQSTAEPKLRFGAVPKPLWIAVRHRNAAVHAALSAARGPLFPAQTFPPHRVFATTRSQP